MKKSTYLKLGIFVLVVLLIYGMCNEPQPLNDTDLRNFMYRGFYHVDSIAKLLTRNTPLDTFIKKINLQAEEERFNEDIKYRLPCGNDTVFIWFLVHSQNQEIHFEYIEGKGEVSEKEYDSLTKIYQQCYENQILNKLK